MRAFARVLVVLMATGCAASRGASSPTSADERAPGRHDQSLERAIGAHWSPGAALERAYPGDVSLPTEIFTDPLDQEAVRAAGQFGFVVTTHGGRPKSYGP